MNYIAHIPLAGGFALGTMNILNKPPIAITSYSIFESNDILFKRYLYNKGINIPSFHIDKLTNIEIENLKETYANVDFISAVPPCSGLSQAATRKSGTRSTAPPNDWMYESAKFILNHLTPTIYVFENAPGLYTNMGKDVRQNLIKIGEDTGYSITFYKTNTIYHGIPQFRPRTFALFYKGPYAPILHSYNRPFININNYLNEIPKNAKHQNEYMHNDWNILNWEITKFFKEIYGDNWREKVLSLKSHITSYEYLKRVGLLNEFEQFQRNLPEEERNKTVSKDIIHIKNKYSQGKNARISYRVLGLDKEYSYAVIGEMMGRQVHPSKNRIMNIREYMHLMGLPHDYNLESPKEFVKISQNVPTCTCEDISREIIEIIKGNRLFAKRNVFMQENKIKQFNKVKSLF